MTNKQIARFIESFKEVRQEWIDILVKNPDRSSAAQNIISVNAKIELLRTMWNFSEEGEMP